MPGQIEQLPGKDDEKDRAAGEKRGEDRLHPRRADVPAEKLRHAPREKKEERERSQVKQVTPRRRQAQFDPQDRIVKKQRQQDAEIERLGQRLALLRGVEARVLRPPGKLEPHRKEILVAQIQQLLSARPHGNWKGHLATPDRLRRHRRPFAGAQMAPRPVPCSLAKIAIGPIGEVLAIRQHSLQPIWLGIVQTHARPQHMPRLLRGRKARMRPDPPARFRQGCHFIDRQRIRPRLEILRRRLLAIRQDQTPRVIPLQSHEHIGHAQHRRGKHSPLGGSRSKRRKWHPGSETASHRKPQATRFPTTPYNY